MSTSDQTSNGTPDPPPGQPRRGSAAHNRPPEEQKNPDATQRIHPEQVTPDARKPVHPAPSSQESTPEPASSRQEQPPQPQVSDDGPTRQLPPREPQPLQQPRLRPPSSATELAELAGHAPRGDTPARRIARGLLRAFSSTQQSRESEEVHAEVQASIATARRIAVASACGGAGKTTVSSLLGSVFATRRAEPVLAVDADPASGSLARRLGIASAMPLPGLAPALQSASSKDLLSVDQLLPRTSRGLWIMPGGTGSQTQLTRDVTRSLSRLFAVAVLDCATGMSAPATSTVLADAHVVVVVVPATPDGVRTTVDALASIPATARQHMVIAVNAVDPHGRANLKTAAAESLFSELGLPVVYLPYDRHVGSGSTIDPDRLAEPTIAAISQLAGCSLRQARPL